MALTDYGVNHPLAAKIWSRKLVREALKQTYVRRFMGHTSDHIVQMKQDAKKAPGDRITCGLRMQLTAAGVAGDATLEGNEEALTTFTDNVFIDQLRHAVRTAGKMSEQRVPFDVREEARAGLVDWWADRIDTWFFNQVCGNTAVTDVRFTGMQAPTAPSGTVGGIRKLFPTGSSNDESVSSVDLFQLSFIDRAVAHAKVATPQIRPVKSNGDEYYVMFLHPFQAFALRTDATAGRITWFEAQKARVAGGEIGDKNGIFSGALGCYNGVILHESTRVPNGIHSGTGAVLPNIRRAVLCGAQAVLMATGETNNDDSPNWFEEMFDSCPVSEGPGFFAAAA